MTGQRPRRRGQTTLDFAIGISLFLMVLVFVLAFVPGLLEPFTATNEEAPVLSDRLADRLSQEALGHPEEPFVLDSDCGVEFFNDTRYENGHGSPSECRYDGNELHERLSITERTNVNVTLEGNVSAGVSGSSLLCWDESADTLKQLGSGDCTSTDDVDLSTGGVPPTNNDATVTARRVVSLDSEDVTMKVVVW